MLWEGFNLGGFMKIKLLFLTLSLASICLGLEEKFNIYPFKDRSNLSFGAFERALRRKYASLDIPEIKTVEHIPILIGYVPDYEGIDFDRKKLGESQGLSHSIQKIVFNPDVFKGGGYSPRVMEFSILHEAGHHNYPRQDRLNNHEQARTILNQRPESEQVIKNCCNGLEKSLMAANAYHIFRYKPNLKLLAAQFVATKAHAAVPFFASLYQNNNAEYARMRSEEIAADLFAIQHGSAEALTAADKEFLSKEEALKLADVTYENQLKFLKNNLGINKFREVLFNIERNIVLNLEKFRYESKRVHDFFDPAHPSHKDRSAMIQAELQRREQEKSQE